MKIYKLKLFITQLVCVCSIFSCARNTKKNVHISSKEVSLIINNLSTSSTSSTFVPTEIQRLINDYVGPLYCESSSTYSNLFGVKSINLSKITKNLYGETLLFNSNTDRIMSVIRLSEYRIATGSWDEGKISVIDIRNKPFLKKKIYTNESISIMTNYGPNQIICGYHSGNIQMWDISKKSTYLKPTLFIIPQSDQTQNIQYGITSFCKFNKHLLVSGDQRGTIRIWDMKTHIQIYELKLKESGPLTYIVSTQDNELIAQVDNASRLHILHFGMLEKKCNNDQIIELIKYDVCDKIFDFDLINSISPLGINQLMCITNYSTIKILDIKQKKILDEIRLPRMIREGMYLGKGMLMCSRENYEPPLIHKKSYYSIINDNTQPKSNQNPTKFVKYKNDKKKKRRIIKKNKNHKIKLKTKRSHSLNNKKLYTVRQHQNDIDDFSCTHDFTGLLNMKAEEFAVKTNHLYKKLLNIGDGKIIGVKNENDKNKVYLLEF